MKLLVMAWRNVWRNSRRSLVTIAAMTLALWAELIYCGLAAGLVKDMQGDVTDLDMGEIQVFSPNWQERPSIHEVVDDDAILKGLDAAGYRATARLQAGGLGASGELSSGVAIVGLDPERDARALTVHEAIAEGSWLDVSDPHGVVVGMGLARTLSLKLGSELVILSQGADGSMANDLYKVRGVLLSVASATDRGAVMMTEGAFRELMALPEGAHRIVVRAPEGVELADAAATVERLAPGTTVRTWKQLNPFIAQLMDTVKVQQQIVYFVMYVAVAILVMNAMLMALFERVRELGVLKAIGWGPAQIFVLMLSEGLLQAVVASLIGAVLAAPFMAWLQVNGVDIGALGGVSMLGVSMPTVWRADYTAEVVKLPITMLYVIVFLSVLYPAAKAALINPIQAMHHS